MRYVMQYGALWKMCDDNYRKLRQLVANGQDYDLDALGKMISGDVYNPLEARQDHDQDSN